MPLDGRLKRKKVKIANFMLCYGCHDFFFKGGNCNFKKGKIAILKKGNWDFPGGPLVKSLPYNVGSNPGRGARIPYATAKSLHSVAKEPACRNYVTQHS